jgi:hypothetical protein
MHGFMANRYDGRVTKAAIVSAFATEGENARTHAGRVHNHKILPSEISLIASSASSALLNGKNALSLMTLLNLFWCMHMFPSHSVDPTYEGQNTHRINGPLGYSQWGLWKRYDEIRGEWAPV